MSIRRHWIPFTITATVVLLAPAILAWLHVVRNVLVVDNRSEQEVTYLTITVTEENIVFANLSPGASVSSTFRIRHDDDFHVVGQLADGTAISGDFGYVTNGMFGEHARFVIQPDGAIEFAQRERAE